MDTPNIKINICSLAYRDKRIIETINDAFEKSLNKENIYLSITIQDSHHHKIKRFSDNDSISYQPWDDYFGFAPKRGILLNRTRDEDYCLLISPGTKFVEGWDAKLIKWIGDHGQNDVLSYENNKFSIKGSLIKGSVIKKIGYPMYLRMMGEEEDVSIKLYSMGYKVLGGIDSVIPLEEEKEWDYIPFSKTHGYNQVTNLYVNAKNDFIDLTQYKEKCFEYANMYPIKKIYHQLDEVLYSVADMNKLEDERFYKHGSRI